MAKYTCSSRAMVIVALVPMKLLLSFQPFIAVDYVYSLQISTKAIPCGSCSLYVEHENAAIYLNILCFGVSFFFFSKNLLFILLIILIILTVWSCRGGLLACGMRRRRWWTCGV